MSDEAKKPVIEAETKEQAALADKEFREAIGTQSVTRNGVSKVLSIFKILKGDNKNKRYLAPQLDSASADTDLKWFGMEHAFGVLNTYLKRVFQETWLENIDPTTGQFNLAKFLTEGADFTSTGMKLKELDDKIDELQAAAALLVMNGDIWKDRATGEKSPDLLKVGELNSSILVYKAMRDKKSRKDKVADAEASVEVK